MLTEEQKQAILSREVELRTSRSGGKGGQNVNKVESRVELSFDVVSSATLTESQRRKLLSLSDQLVEGRYLRVQESRDRSQLANRGLAEAKLIAFIDKALKPKKKRIPTKPSKASKKRKLDDKRRHSELKRSRREF